MEKTPKEYLIQYRRLLQLRGRIESYELKTIQSMLDVYEKAVSDIKQQLKKTRSLETKAQQRKLIREIEKAHKQFSTILTETMAEGVTEISKEMFDGMVKILSWDGKIKPFNIPADRVDTTLNAIANVPIGGKLLADWVEKTFDDTLELQKEILSSNLAGEGYRKMYNRLANLYPEFTRKELITLARTFNQSVVVSAQEKLFEENKDIVKKVKWTAAMEMGFKKSGRGTCMACACLDGRVYEWDQPRPNNPLHARCRCMWSPVTLTWNELLEKHKITDKDGNPITVDELEDEYKPFLTRKNKNIDVGRGKGNILQQEWTDQDYGDFITGKGKAALTNVVGPKRAELIMSGKISFDDLVDPKTGKIRTLSELGYIPPIKPQKRRRTSGGGSSGTPVFPKFEPPKLPGWSSPIPMAKEFTKGLPEGYYFPHHEKFLGKDGGYTVHDSPSGYFQKHNNSIHLTFAEAGTANEASTFMHEFGHRIDAHYVFKVDPDKWGFPKHVPPSNYWISTTPKYIKAWEDDYLNIQKIQEDAQQKVETRSRQQPFSKTRLKGLKAGRQETYNDLYLKHNGNGVLMGEEISKMSVSPKYQFMKDLTDEIFDLIKKEFPAVITDSVFNLKMVDAYQAIINADKFDTPSFILEEWLNAIKVFPAHMKNATRVQVYLADTIEGTTKAEFGWGHGREYVLRFPENSKVEPFANIFLLYGNKNAMEFFKLFTPNQLRVFEELMEEVLK